MGKLTGPETGGGGGGAPANADFLTLSLNATLTNERVFTPGTNLSAVDGGPGGLYTLNAAASGAPVGASYVVVGFDATLTDERRLQIGAGLSLVDGGAGGDITVAVAALGITTGLLADAAVTFGKIQDINSDRLLGRDAAGVGDVEEISLDATLEFTGAQVIRRAAITGDVTIGAGSNAAVIPANTITNLMLRDSAAFSVIGKFNAGAGDPADIVAADETVLGRTGGGNLAFAQVATGQIADDAVTYAKIQNVTDARLLGRSAGGAGDVQEITVGSPLTLAAGALDFDETVAIGNNARVAVSENSGATVGTRRRINFIEGANIALTIADDAGNEEVDVTITGTGGAGSFSATQVTVALPFPAQRRQVVTVVDAAVTATDKIFPTLAGVAETLENASDSVDLLAMQALPAAGSFQLQLNFRDPTAGALVINYARAA